jgi:hypothetical protein
MFFLVIMAEEQSRTTSSGSLSPEKTPSSSIERSAVQGPAQAPLQDEDRFNPER